MWSPKEVQGGRGRRRRGLCCWGSWRGEPAAESRGSQVVEPAAPCWVWVAVWDTAGCRSLGWADLQNQTHSVFLKVLQEVSV